MGLLSSPVSAEMPEDETFTSVVVRLDAESLDLAAVAGWHAFGASQGELDAFYGQMVAAGAQRVEPVVPSAVHRPECAPRPFESYLRVVLAEGSTREDARAAASTLAAIDGVADAYSVIEAAHVPGHSVALMDRTGHELPIFPHANSGLDLADRIVRAIDRSADGEVIVVRALAGLHDRRPVDVRPAVADAIRYARCLDREVVAAASVATLDRHPSMRSGVGTVLVPAHEIRWITATSISQLLSDLVRGPGQLLTAPADRVQDNVPSRFDRQPQQAADLAGSSDASAPQTAERRQLTPPAVATASLSPDDEYFRRLETEVEEKAEEVAERAKGTDNQPPYAEADYFEVIDGTTSFEIPHAALLENDVDSDGDALVILGYPSMPTNGTLRSGIGRFIYEPLPEFFDGRGDAFTYTIRDRGDGTGLESTGIVYLELNKPPSANHDRLEVPIYAEQVSIPFNTLLRNDGDPERDELSILNEVVEPSERGVLERHESKFVFYPGPEMWRFCEDHFTYRVVDRVGPEAVPSGEARVDLVCRRIFADTFETGDSSAWSAFRMRGGASFRPAAGDGDRQALAVDIPDAVSDAAWLTDRLPDGEEVYRARLVFDASDLMLVEGATVPIFKAHSQSDNGPLIFELVLNRTDGLDQIGAGVATGARSWHETPKAPLVGRTLVEIVWWAGSPERGPSGAAVWVDGEPLDELTLDQVSPLRVDVVHLGRPPSEGSEASGTLVFHHFSSYPD
ncbi:MAG: Ig-like domain-containing protein [Acidobacteriota bacterium]